jgi:GxxExxY protein
VALKDEDLTSRIIGVYYDVYNELGHGFLESVYERAMVFALKQAGVPVTTQVPIAVSFREQRVGDFKADLVIDEKILVELKAVEHLEKAHYAQVMNYLKATKMEVGLLFNFGRQPAFKRFLFENSLKQIRSNPCESVLRF